MRQNVALHNKSWPRPESKRLKGAKTANKAQKKLCGTATMSRKALFPSGQENRTGGPSTQKRLSFFSKQNRSDRVLRNSWENRSLFPKICLRFPVLALARKTARKFDNAQPLIARFRAE
ncbi:hypothetical protein HFN78_34895 [Rhizobium laguerreae]|uniref:hypothetical protein n=1 Tax=Rhizobium laguerreae TaxID=1076926 RepID=UPI001C916727|nr:hypothetical protein [Rhizobium laguerreae]MBY3296320.1 hypothetical protein [Rhizobium laguerreae]MBY3476024.1 hypothetical protein [Rhizobium laguerreae]MBY3524068.1 hypothetical protein [Rhizobium laguerreae]